MTQREITLWVDERWCKALEKHLLDGTVAEKLEEYIDELVNKLPENVYERISGEIWQEREQAKQEAEAARRFAVLHVTENGSSTYIVAEENLEMLHVADRLRKYTRKPTESSPTRFTGMFSKGEKISREQSDAYVQERLKNTGRVVGAFDIDMDKSRFDSLHITEGWQCYRIQDVSTATYYAMKKAHTFWGEREYIFHSRLDGKELIPKQEPGYILGKRMLRDEEICMCEDIIQNGNLLEFCLDWAIDADSLFRSHTCDYDNGDWFNIYANYDLEAGSICDALDVFLQHNDGGEEDYKYRLSDAEKDLLLSKMEEYCHRQLGLSLEECCQQYLAEQQQEQQSSGMVFG